MNYLTPNAKLTLQTKNCSYVIIDNVNCHETEVQVFIGFTTFYTRSSVLRVLQITRSIVKRWYAEYFVRINSNAKFLRKIYILE